MFLRLSLCIFEVRTRARLQLHTIYFESAGETKQHQNKKARQARNHTKHRPRTTCFTFVLCNVVDSSEILSPTPGNSRSIQCGTDAYGSFSSPHAFFIFFASTQSLPCRGHPFGVALASTITATWINLLSTGVDLTPKP
jgi:hypothetical protein